MSGEAGQDEVVPLPGILREIVHYGTFGTGSVHERAVLDAADEIERLRAIVHADALSRMHMLDQAHQDIRYLCDRLNSIEVALTGMRSLGHA